MTTRSSGDPSTPRTHPREVSAHLWQTLILMPMVFTLGCPRTGNRRRSREEGKRMSAEHSKPRTMPRVRDGVRLGMFLPNQRNSNFVTTADNGGTDATWQDVKRVALLGEEVGLSFLLPVARWKGLKGDIVDVNPYGLETVTLTASILALTRRITMLTTMHTA